MSEANRSRFLGLLPQALGSPAALLESLRLAFQSTWPPFHQALATADEDAIPVVAAVDGFSERFLGEPLFLNPSGENEPSPQPHCVLPSPEDAPLHILPLENQGYWILASATAWDLEGSAVLDLVPIVSSLAVACNQPKRSPMQLASLEESDRLAGLGRLLAGIAHELRGPLQSIISKAELLARGSEPASPKTLGEHFLQAGLRCRDILEGVLPQAQRPSGHTAFTISLHDCFLEALELDRFSQEGEVEIAMESQGTPMIRARKGRLVQVLLNLLTNARHAVREARGRQTVRITIESIPGTESRLPVDPGQEVVRASVQDQGAGVPAEIADLIFDPFFTTRSGGEGTGLGLAISREIVVKEGGILYLDRTHEVGARFVLEFPAEESPPPLPTATSSAPGPCGLSILTIDDDVELLETYRAILSLDDHEVLGCSSLKAGLAAIESQHFDVIITDQRLPDGKGLALVETLRETHPHLAQRIILATGDVAREDSKEAIEKAGVPLLLKPFQIDDLSAAIASLLA